MRLLATITLIVLTITAQAQPTLTLADALNIGLENNYGIQIVRNQTIIANNNLTRGNAGFLPTVEATFNQNYGLSSFEQQLSSGGERSDQGVQTSNRNYGAALDWTVFDGFSMFRRFDQLSATKSQTEEQLRSSMEQLIFDIMLTYYQVGLETERLRLFEGNVALSEDRMNIARDKYELGKASKLEFLQAQVDYNSDKSALITQSEFLSRVKYDLLRLLSSSDSVNFNVSSRLNIDSTLQVGNLLAEIDIKNPGLMASRQAIIIARQEEEINKGERLPELGLFARYTHTSFNNPASFASEGMSDNFSYGFNARINIFDGFNLNRRIQNARIQAENAELQYQQTLLDLETQVKQTYLDYANNLRLIQLEKENLEVARENNEIAQERYEIGLSNALELRESQIDLVDAELRLQNASFLAKFAEIELKFLSGELTVSE